MTLYASRVVWDSCAGLGVTGINCILTLHNKYTTVSRGFVADGHLQVIT